VTPERPVDLALTTEQNWASWSHRDLYEAVHQNNDPGKSGELGWHWEQFGSWMTESATTIDKELTATESGWTGTSADAARAAIRALAQWVTDTAHDATELGAKVQEQSRIMESARAAMPEPVEFDWDAASGTLSGPGIASFTASAADVQAANEKARAAHEQAVRVMTDMEGQSRAVDATTPNFTAPFNPTTGRTAEVTLATPTAPGASASRGGTDEEQRSATPSGPSVSPEDLVSTEDSGQQVLTAAAGVPGGPVGGGIPAPVEQYSSSGQHAPGHAGTVAAAAAAAGAGAYALRGTGRRADDTDAARRPGLPDVPDIPDLPETALGSSSTGRDSGQPAVKAPVPPAAAAPPSHAGPSGAMPSAFPGGGGFGGMPRMPKGKQQDGDITLSPGRSTGTTNATDGPASFGPNASGVVGGGGPADGGMMPPPAGMGRGGGAEDTERKTAYVESEDLFDVPGDELPPSVIGGRKAPRTGGDSS
jgi:hypothetical protein